MLNASPDNNYFSKDPPLVNLNHFKSWIIHEDHNLLVLNKPGWLVCHPSKNGPLSSLVGAAREYLNQDRLHIISRLDRETSGVTLLAKNHKTASLYQSTIQNRIVQKTYLAILHGHLNKITTVNAPLSKDTLSKVHVKQTVSSSKKAKDAITIFSPISHNDNYTLVSISLLTGRKHQIRAHAQHILLPIVGDKIYGPNESLYLQFIEHGWTPNMQQALPIKRQALHCFSMTFSFPNHPHTSFCAPLTQDLQDFCNSNNLSFPLENDEIIINL